MYCMNKIVVVSQKGLFLYVNLSYLTLIAMSRSCNTQDTTWIGKNILSMETTTSYTFLGIRGTWVQRCSFSVTLGWMSVPNVPCNAINAFNKMHACYRVCVECALEAWSESLQGWWNDLMLKNQSTYTCLGLVPFGQTFFIEEGWIGHKRLLEIELRTQRLMVGRETISGLTLWFLTCKFFYE